MKPTYSPTPAPDVLLRQGLRETSPEFEARWVALKRKLRREGGAARPTAGAWRHLWLRAVIGTGLLAMLVLGFFFALPVESPPPSSARIATAGAVSDKAVEEMLALDQSLAPALGILDPELLETLVMLANN